MRDKATWRGRAYLALALVLVKVREVILWEFKRESKQDVQRVKDLRVQSLSKAGSDISCTLATWYSLTFENSSISARLSCTTEV